MNERVILPGVRSGTVTVPPSKSEAHRLLIAALLSGRPLPEIEDGLSEDIQATAECLRALRSEKETADLFCRESGSTLRFLLPVAGALRKTAVFHREGRLPERPLEPLLSELKAHGMTFEENGALLFVSGRLSGGRFTLPGDVSSQFVSGLLFALPILPESSELLVTGRIESEAYIEMTLETIRKAGVSVRVTETPEGRRYEVPGRQNYRLPETLAPGGDWSGASFFFAMGALSETGVTVEGLSADSPQGDKAMLSVLERFGAEVKIRDGRVTVSKGRLKGCSVDAAMIPDLVPPIAVVAALSEGETVIGNAGRLRIKESDRLKTTASLINALGGKAEEMEDGLRIYGVGKLKGGRVTSASDHRIAMSAAAAAAGSEQEIIIEDPDVVRKSFPGFYEELEKLSRSEGRDQ